MKKLYTLFIILLLAGCAKRQEMAKPVPFIPMEKMEAMMIDCYMLEAAMRIYENDTSIDMEVYGQQEWKKLLEKHQLTTENWENNFRYYISKPPLRDTLMKHIGNRLTEMEAAEEVNFKTNQKNSEKTDKQFLNINAVPKQIMQEENVLDN